MQKPTPVHDYRPSPTAIQAIRVAIAALFVAIGVALSPFSVPIFGAKAFPVQSFLLAALIGALAACIVIIALWKARVRPRATERSLV